MERNFRPPNEDRKRKQSSNRISHTKPQIKIVFTNDRDDDRKGTKATSSSSGATSDYIDDDRKQRHRNSGAGGRNCGRSGDEQNPLDKTKSCCVTQTKTSTRFSNKFDSGDDEPS